MPSAIQKAVSDRVASLTGGASQYRHVAGELLRRHGRFLEPILGRLLQVTNDTALQARIGQLMQLATEIAWKGYNR
jgi:hypothetical protein